MRAINAERWDDLALGLLLLLIGVPRALLAILYDRPIGVEGVLSMVCVLFALLILLHRNLLPRT